MLTTLRFCQARLCVSLLLMNHEQAIRIRERLLARLPAARDVLRGSLLDRTIRHRSGCPKCHRGEGHPVSVLAVGYPGGRVRQISLRKNQVAGVRRSLANYRKLKSAIEQICESFRRVVLILDGDDGGRKATARIAAQLAGKCSVGLVAVPNGSQPDQLNRAELAALLAGNFGQEEATR